MYIILDDKNLIESKELNFSKRNVERSIEGKVDAFSESMKELQKIEQIIKQSKVSQN